MIRRNIWLVLIPILLSSGCLSLDPFLFNEEEVSEYKLYNYDGEREISEALIFLEQNGYERLVTTEYSYKSGDETVFAILADSDSTLNPEDTVIIYFHGTSGHIDFVWPRIALVAAAGYPVFAIDYQGYGKSSGKPSEKALYKDGRASVEFLKNVLGVNNIVLYAYSMGTLVGAELSASDSTLLKLVLESSIGSVETLVGDASYLNFPGSFVTTFTGNNIERVKKIKMPLLLLHGEDDKQLAIKTNGKPLWENYAGSEGYALFLSKSDHSDIPKILGYSEYINVITQFVRGEEFSSNLILKK